MPFATPFTDGRGVWDSLQVRIAAMAGVTKNIVHPGDYAGFPAAPAAEWRRGLVAARRSPLVAGAR